MFKSQIVFYVSRCTHVSDDTSDTVTILSIIQIQLCCLFELNIPFITHEYSLTKIYRYYSDYFLLVVIIGILKK